MGVAAAEPYRHHSLTPATAHRACHAPRRLPVLEARRVKRRWIALTALLLLAGMALGGYVYARNRTGSIYHPHARFVPQANPTLPKRGPERFSWPLYGYTANHARYYPAPASLRPPFKKVWAVGGSSLREFPPVLSENRIFQLTDNGVLTAVDKWDGQILWSRGLGALSASTPAVGGDTVYATVLARAPGSEEGRIVALDVTDGAIRWSRIAALAQRVLAAARPRPAVLRLRRRYRVRARSATVGAPFGPTTRPARSRPARRS